MLSQTHRVVLALLFGATEPLNKAQVDVCLEEDVNLVQIVADLNAYLETESLPIWIQNVAEGYRLMICAEYESWLSRLFQNKSKLRLSRPALETLAIIAYKQPITKSEIDAIRGVDTTLKPLIEKNLIKITGRQDGPGRPLLYGTTAHFLEYFGLASLKDLPRAKELTEIVREDNTLFDSAEQDATE
ncbi:MAG: SMC-Scp complex subunit ScpB [Candidatus Marinimicrobia bacterium]|jgi:segregation and condensation protein B|nr:SMC-Scp complex subunit ScpB [Candidatus Neomarinimicrobiota bacterium]MCK9483049.1 SMC-Scp complex subunit ScpB [Candidatus Neomarinimicrobiota bacterium]MCK9559081.1 SMC-Scp complex subunit ScpB [Candidatus Neomarinimicrobiota bacterium]